MSVNPPDPTFLFPALDADDERLRDENPTDYSLRGYAPGDARNDPISISSDEEEQPDNMLMPAPPAPDLSAAECVQLIRGILTDISVEYAHNMVHEGHVKSAEACENLIAMLLDEPTYPKEPPRAKRRRSGTDDDEESKIAKFRKSSLSRDYAGHAVRILADLFPEFAVTHITETIRSKGTLYASYQFLAEQRRNRGGPTIRNPRAPTSQLWIDNKLAAVPGMAEELQAARKNVEEAAEKDRQTKAKERAEEENLLQAQRNGEMDDCCCCYGDYPMNRMVNCSGDTIHLFCQECARRYVESEIGFLRCRPVCFASEESCGGTFTRSQLQSFLDPKTFERLENLQQQDDIQAAGLDLTECPFCDFKADCGLVEGDKEFRCLNPNCRKTSCRLCEKETHIPLSCEEASANISAESARQKVEEAKSEALIRRCNRCSGPFIKQHGCNKMTCPKCHNIMCYVCLKDLDNSYNHFERGPAGEPGSGGCPLHDRGEDIRHLDEVRDAEKKAVAEVRATNPNLTDADLGVDKTLHAKEAGSQHSRRDRHARYREMLGAFGDGGRPAIFRPFGDYRAPANPFYPARFRNQQGLQAIDGGPNQAYAEFPQQVVDPFGLIPNPQQPDGLVGGHIEHQAYVQQQAQPVQAVPQQLQLGQQGQHQNGQQPDGQRRRQEGQLYGRMGQYMQIGEANQYIGQPYPHTGLADELGLATHARQRVEHRQQAEHAHQQAHLPFQQLHQQNMARPYQRQAAPRLQQHIAQPIQQQHVEQQMGHVPPPGTGQHMPPQDMDPFGQLFYLS